MTQGSKKLIKLDYSRGYMKVEIGYCIVLLSQIMGLGLGGYLNT